MTESPTRIDRYQVIQRLGHGGMGSVYLARDPAIGRLTAIKLLKEEFDDDLRERFAREARAVGSLEHPNIVTLYDIGDHEGRPFIAMRYVSGETLADLIRRRATIPVTRKLRLIEELCAGVHAAHQAGIVHRDIKPANVMVDADGEVKILDFGIARLAQSDSQQTQVGTVIGSYNYMSPEQMAGHPVGFPSDIFSVGAVFYELLCYFRAFPGTMQEGLWHRVVREPTPPLAERCENLDPEVERVVMRALEKAPANRYPDLASMRRDIARLRARLEAADRERLLAAAERELADGDADRALASAQEALELDQENERANEVVARARTAVETRLAVTNARAALAAGTYDKAILFAEQALALDPSSSDAIAIKDEAKVLREAQKAQQAEQLVAERRHTLTAQLTKARGLYKGRQYRDALKAIDAVLDAPAIEETGLRDEAAALCDAIEDGLIREVLDEPEPVTPHADEASAEAGEDPEIPTVVIPRPATEQLPVRRRPIVILAIVVTIVVVWFLLIR